jgi:predicted ATPase
LAIGHITYTNSWFREAFRAFQYISAYRQKPDRTYLFAGQNPSTVGGRGERAIDLLLADYLRKRRGKAAILDDVKNWMQRASLASLVDVAILSDRHFELKVQHPITHETENIADVGSGLSQVLPILVAGYWARSGSTLVVEEPEIHLHPRAQAELGQFFFELYRNRVQIIAETHSEHLLLRLQRLVAEGRIPPEQIAVYYVWPKGRVKRIEQLNLSGKGLFEGEWPEGFFPERMTETRAILRGPASRKG